VCYTKVLNCRLENWIGRGCLCVKGYTGHYWVAYDLNVILLYSYTDTHLYRMLSFSIISPIHVEDNGVPEIMFNRRNEPSAHITRHVILDLMSYENGYK
jgi:hypothetical protein